MLNVIPQQDFCHQCQRLLRARPLQILDADGHNAWYHALFESNEPARDPLTAAHETYILTCPGKLEIPIPEQLNRLNDEQSRIIVYGLRYLANASATGCHLCAVLWQRISPNFVNAALDDHICLPYIQHVSRNDGLARSLVSSLYLSITNMKSSNTQPPKVQGGSMKPWSSCRECEYITGIRSVDQSWMKERIQPKLAKVAGMKSDTTSTGALPTTHAGLEPDTAREINAWIDTSIRMSAITEATSTGKGLPPKDLAFAEPPRRLLCLAGQNGNVHVKIVETKDLDDNARISYTTLSYCWGGDPIVNRLQRHNLQEYKQNLATTHLPRTFRDAIEVTVSLGYQYLWIDALCIIQDAVDDWRTEAARMADIYRNCVLNLSASRGVSANDGLLNQDPLLAPFATQASWVTPSPTEIVLFDNTRANWRRYVYHGPLKHRAWVFQEKDLSPRILHFPDDQLYCEQEIVDPDKHMHCLLSEAFGFRPGGFTEDSPWFLTKSFFRLGPDKHQSSSWESIVRQYSATNITKRSDRLIALAGIASEHARRSSAPLGSYVAGLWIEDLPKALLWLVMGYTRYTCTDMDTDYVAPSWSWASVVSSVNFYKGQKTLSDCHIRNVNVQTVDGNPLSQVVAGSIIIQAPLSLFLVSNLDIFHHERLAEHTHFRCKANFPGRSSHTNEQECGCRFWLSSDPRPQAETFIQGRSVLCHIAEFVTTIEEEVRFFYRSILLCPVKGRKGVYRRAGFFSHVWGNHAMTFRETYRAEKPLDEDLYIQSCGAGVYEIELI